MNIRADQLAEQVGRARARGWAAIMRRAEEAAQAAGRSTARGRIARDRHGRHRRRAGVTGEGSFRSTTGFTPTGSLHTGPPARPRPRGSKERRRIRRIDARVEPGLRRSERRHRARSDQIRLFGLQRRARRGARGPPERRLRQKDDKRAATTAATCSSAWGRSSLGRARRSSQTSGDRILRKGNRGADVLQLKRDLRAWFDRAAPGVWQTFRVQPGPVFGAALTSAVRDFQMRNALLVDGEVGEDTRGALARASAPKTGRGRRPRRSRPLEARARSSDAATAGRR